jgi:hypothetical protein
MKCSFIAITITITITIAIGVLHLSASAQTSQPASDSRLEYRAGQAFDRGDYAAALPLLRKLVDELKDRPAKVAVIVDRIKVCEKAVSKTNAATPMGVAERKPHPIPAPGEVQELTIKELGNFEYNPDVGANIPDDVKRLSGSKIRLTGYMIPLDQAGHVTQFALVPSLFSCCFGQPPQIQHTIVCTCPKGSAVSYDPGQIVVEGVLKVEEKRDDGYVTSIFQVEPKSVTEAPKNAKR